MKTVNLDPNLTKVFNTKFETKDQMKDWVFLFLGLDLPDSYIDPDSNSSPIEWMFDVYNMYKTNTADQSPSVITVSSRESYKTLTEAILAVILMGHFNATICHMAAIVPQATAAQKYITNFLAKVTPYMEYFGRSINSQNAKEVSIKNPDGSSTWMKIVVCTIAGANSSHSNVLCVDEVDTIRSQEGIRAYKEAEFIPGVFNGQNPITIKTSTMKFPGGLFSKEMEKASKENWKTFKWNILDITEYCPSERARPDLPKKIMYTRDKKLPLKAIGEKEYESLTDKEKEEYIKQDAMGGCAGCPLLPVCKGRLHQRRPSDKGGLWKPISFTISQFKKTDPDLGEAQLMCWKPSSQGMVYGRFLERADGKGNTYTLKQAWEVFTGDEAPENVNITMLTQLMKEKGISFYAGVDWGFRHYFAITISALMPNKEWWIIDSYAVSGLEFEQMMDLAMQVRDIYKPKMWFADTAQPMFIKAFKKNKMPCKNFKKDVMGGISAVRGQIVDAKDTRRLKVIIHDRNESVLIGFREHTFMLDSLGNITQEPDDSEVADTMDTLRYQAQNLFAPKNKPTVTENIEKSTIYMDNPYGDRPEFQTPQHSWNEIKKKAMISTAKEEITGDTKGSDGIIWTFDDE
jgi:hypothetical protein